MAQGSPAGKPGCASCSAPSGANQPPKPTTARAAWDLLEAGPERLGQACGMVPLDDGCVWLAEDVIEPFRRQGLTTFDAFLNCQGENRIQRHTHHWNCRFRAAEADGRQRTFYLKRNRDGSLLSWLRQRVVGKPQQSSGMTEMAGVVALGMCGVPTVRAVGWGQRHLRPWLVESFFISEELPDAIPVDDYLREHFAGPLLAGQLAAKRDLVRRVADLVRRFHRAGLNHQDLYTNHVFVGRGPDRPLFLIDLHRVQHRRWLRRRYVVKDLGQLSASTPEAIVSRTDRMRFWKRYRGIGDLGPAEKRLFRRVRRRHNHHTRRRRRRARALASES